MKTALVTGGLGFIGGHLCQRLRSEGYWVRAVDIRRHAWTSLSSDETILLDLRIPENALDAVRLPMWQFDEVYQLAADFGGMGYIEAHPIECMTFNLQINLNMLRACALNPPGRYFFSSSVCVYRDMEVGEDAIPESAAYPAMPDNEYGWEKLYSERLTTEYGKAHKFQTRIARFQNCYGPHCGWYDGREKAPAALCRKAALAQDGSEIEVWGDGSAVRNYIYVDDLIDGIRTLMQSDQDLPTNIGTDEYVTVDELANTIIHASGKRLGIQHVVGIVGVESRNFTNDRIKALGWKPKNTLSSGIPKLYKWIARQVGK